MPASLSRHAGPRNSARDLMCKRSHAGAWCGAGTRNDHGSHPARTWNDDGADSAAVSCRHGIRPSRLVRLDIYPGV